MKIITIALLLISFNSYSTIEECNDVATFGRNTLEAAASGISIADYIKDIDQTRLKEAVYSYKWFRDHGGQLMSAEKAEVLINNAYEDNLISCYEDVLEMK